MYLSSAFLISLELQPLLIPTHFADLKSSINCLGKTSLTCKGLDFSTIIHSTLYAFSNYLPKFSTAYYLLI